MFDKSQMHRHAFFLALLESQQRTAIVDGEKQYSYAALLSAAMSVRAQLLGDSDDLDESRVAFLIHPGFDYSATLFGIWAAGGVAVPLSLQHPLPELDYVIKDTRASILIVGPEFVSVGQEIAAISSLTVLATTDLGLEETRAVELAELPVWNADRKALILYTSGSTGRPKGVVTTHGNIASQVESLVEAWEWEADDRILHVLPLHHIHGIINVLLCSFRVGAVCEFAHPFNAKVVWDRIASGALTLFMAVPTIYAKLVAAYEQAAPDQQTLWSKTAEAMRLHVSGSAALPVPVLERWESITGQRLLERYGMTEIGMGLSNPYLTERRAGFVGRPLPNIEARRTLESGDLAADDEPGEIEIRGSNVFLEYWCRPDETAAAFRDGWFRTGDIAIVDNGDYRILGRSSVDIIKTGGYKVSALEIEEVLRTHPCIVDCAVVGVPDSEWGERVAVCAVCDSSLDLQSLRDWSKERLATYKAPSILSVCDELPRNAMGKVQKKLVQKLFEN
jgi:malonyl-CoA/methylmalonyl-CoA synthetase